MKNKIIVIVGPTAVGKTALSIEVAKRFNGQIISGDSQQVYRGLDIGTAKIRPEEQEGIPHHLWWHRALYPELARGISSGRLRLSRGDSGLSGAAG